MDSCKVTSDMMRFLTAVSLRSRNRQLTALLRLSQSVSFCLLRQAAVGVFDSVSAAGICSSSGAGWQGIAEKDAVALDDGHRRKFFDGSVLRFLFSVFRHDRTQKKAPGNDSGFAGR